jgi:hypothetical protein
MNGKIWHSTAGIPLSTDGMRPGRTKTILERPRLSWDNKNGP